MASVQVALQPLGDDMKIFTNHSLAGAQAPVVSVARDVVRIVITAVLAGTAFAVLLALTVLSLTVIAPPAQASGGVVMTSADSGPGRGNEMQTPARPDVIALQAASPQGGTPVAAATALPPDSTHEGVYNALPKTANGVPYVLYLLLALGAGFLAYFAYSLARRKS
jgi:hypothetical protein